MESEKAIYWTTLGVLALAAVTGLSNGHQGWGDRLADRSIAMVAQASGIAKNYAEVAAIVLGSDESDSVRPTQAFVAVQDDLQDEVLNEVQPRLACAESILVRQQAKMARLRAVKVRVRMLEVPELPEMPQQSSF